MPVAPATNRNAPSDRAASTFKLASSPVGGLVPNTAPFASASTTWPPATVRLVTSAPPIRMGDSSPAGLTTWQFTTEPPAFLQPRNTRPSPAGAAALTGDRAGAGGAVAACPAPGSAAAGGGADGAFKVRIVAKLPVSIISTDPSEQPATSSGNGVATARHVTPCGTAI